MRNLGTCEQVWRQVGWQGLRSSSVKAECWRRPAETAPASQSDEHTPGPGTQVRSGMCHKARPSRPVDGETAGVENNYSLHLPPRCRQEGRAGGTAGGEAEAALDEETSLHVAVHPGCPSLRALPAYGKGQGAAC